MDGRDKGQQLKLIEEEKPASDNAVCSEANGKKTRKNRGGRSSKFCCQPGEMKLIKKNK